MCYTFRYTWKPKAFRPWEHSQKDGLRLSVKDGSSDKLKIKLMNPMVGNITEKLSSVDYEKVEEMMKKIRNVKKVPYVSAEEMKKLGY